MAQPFIEHVNITVSNPERTAQMLGELFDWRIRWQGPSAMGGHSIHVGDETFYIAAYASDPGRDASSNHAKGAPLNHIGIVVDDLDETERRVLKLGLKPFSHDNYDPGRRFYFFDHDGIEFEIVSYA